MKKITEYPEIEELKDSDKVFVNYNGELKQILKQNLLPASLPADGGTADTISGTLPISKGGTGATTAMEAQYNILSGIYENKDNIEDIYKIAFVNLSPSVGTGRLHYRNVTKLWDYIKSKISSVLGLTSTDYNGNSATATKATQDGDGNVIPDTYATKTELVENTYEHPTTSGNKHIPSGGASGQILRWSEDGTVAWESPSDSSSSGTFSSSSTKLITERDAYYGTPNFNGAKKSNSTTLYAPTTAGTSGYLLQSSGSGAPSWKKVISSSEALTDTGKYALDAVQNNASVEGTLANKLAKTYCGTGSATSSNGTFTLTVPAGYTSAIAQLQGGWGTATVVNVALSGTTLSIYTNITGEYAMSFAYMLIK